MRIGLLTGWGSRLGGGVFEAVVTQAQLLCEQGHQVTVFAPADAHSAADRARFDPRVEFVLRPMVGPGLFGWAPGLRGAIVSRALDVVHLHGIWRHASIVGAHWARAHRRRYVISPHGMLDPWITGRGRLKKWIAERTYERRSWRRAALFHALTEAEAHDIRTVTGRREIVVVPNPVAIPDRYAAAPDGDDRYLLFLARIHPKKNLDGLVAAWRRLRADGAAPGWRLVIAGWGEPQDVQAFEALLAEHADATLTFVGGVFGADKQQLIAGAAFVILPSFSEGLPMTILEAWAAATPTIMSDGCNLPEGFAGGAAIRCGTDPESIAAAVGRAVTLPAAERETMRLAARTLAEQSFSPDAIGRTWSGLYDRLTHDMQGPSR